MSAGPGPLVDVIAGARPNFMKIAPILHAFQQRQAGVITDSGGVTEETTVMGVPCMTLRDSTERPETVTTGTNELIGTDPAALQPALGRLFDGAWKKGAIPEKWDGQTGARIAALLDDLLCT